MSNLSTIIAHLTELTADELSVVIATASQLKAVKSISGRPNQTKFGKGKVANKVGNPARKSKGPAKLVSQFADVPEYQAFKAAEKELRSLLKAEKISLKEANSSEQWQDHPVITQFNAAQQHYFRVKTDTKDVSAESSAS